MRAVNNEGEIARGVFRRLVTHLEVNLDSAVDLDGASTRPGEGEGAELH